MTEVKYTSKQIAQLRDIIGTTAVYSDWCDGITCLQLRGFIDEFIDTLEIHYLQKEDDSICDGGCIIPYKGDLEMVVDILPSITYCPVCGGKRVKASEEEREAHHAITGE